MQRRTGRTHWECSVLEYEDGASHAASSNLDGLDALSGFSDCKSPDPRSVHRQRHLVYPQLNPGDEWL